MKSFRFPLQRVLDIGSRELALAEVQFQGAAASIAHADREREILVQARDAVERQVRRAEAVPGRELAALEWFHKRTAAEDKRIVRVRAERVRILEASRAAMLEARRLLEQLKEKRWAEWSGEANEEMEEPASESYLAR
jgi:hypothetical protein